MGLYQKHFKKNNSIFFFHCWKWIQKKKKKFQIDFNFGFVDFVEVVVEVDCFEACWIEDKTVDEQVGKKERIGLVEGKHKQGVVVVDESVGVVVEDQLVEQNEIDEWAEYVEHDGSPQAQFGCFQEVKQSNCYLFVDV